jgi:hypothetical protein
MEDPGLVANTYLEGTYSELYPNISQTQEGLRKLFKQFSFPGGIPGHVAQDGHPRAKLAFEIFVHRLQAGIGAMIAVLGGIDALVFTAQGSEKIHLRCELQLVPTSHFLV